MIRPSLAVFLGCFTLACTAQTPPAATPTAVTSTAPGVASTTPPPVATPLPMGTPAAGPAKITFSQVRTDERVIAMTYDDGPHGANTPRLLDMLKQRKIRATFFVVGQCVAEFPAIMKRIVGEGHELGNHSWSHPQLSSMSDAGVRDQLQKTHDVIVQTTGVTPKLLRPPYGAFTTRQQRWAQGEWGYKTILWDVDPLDWKVRNAAHVQSEILKHTVPGSIVLSHDIHKTTIDAMPATLDALLDRGFKFVTVSELLAMDRPATPKPKPTPTPAAPPRE